MGNNGERVHFVGIGGIGMSGIARILLQKGVRVSGSDCKESANTQRLRECGAMVTIGHAAANVRGASEVVVSSAIRHECIEILEARRLGIPVVHRAQKLAQLLNSHRGITIAGTHGKTTTSSMTATLLSAAGLSPSFVVGGIINAFSDNACAGDSDWFVIEADESDGTLVEFRPEIALLTNIEMDHADYFRDQAHLSDTFGRHLENIQPGGLCIWCADDPGVSELMQRHRVCRRLSYGLVQQAQIMAANIRSENLGSTFEVRHEREAIGELQLQVPGRHNVQNSLAAVGVGLELGLSWESIQSGLGSFRGVQRRFQIVGRDADHVIVDDYGHHPSEVRATLAAARSVHHGRIVAVFQPHRYSRTQALALEFGGAFGDADEVVVTDIYSAGEDPIPGIGAELIVQSLKLHHHRGVHEVCRVEQLEDYVTALARPNDMILTIGAGDIWKIAQRLAHRLTASAGEECLSSGEVVADDGLRIADHP